MACRHQHQYCVDSYMYSKVFGGRIIGFLRVLLGTDFISIKGLAREQLSVYIYIHYGYWNRSRIFKSVEKADNTARRASHILIVPDPGLVGMFNLHANCTWYYQINVFRLQSTVSSKSLILSG